MSVNTSNEKTSIQELYLYKGKDGEYYLSITYRHEDERDISVCRIPKVHLPIRRDMCVINQSYNEPPTLLLNNDIELDILPDKNGITHTVEVVETKVHEMTVEEIEKKLGYKVKIVHKEVVIKGSDKCQKCAYHVLCTKCGNCLNCPSRKKLGHCPCTEVANGEPCPHFEEA